MGLLASDAAGNITGTVDSVDGNGAGMGATFTGSYSMGNNGRSTLTTTSDSGTKFNWILYIVSTSKVILRQASVERRTGCVS